LAEIELIEIFVIIGISIGSLLGVVKLIFIIKDRRPQFRYQKFKEGEEWKIMISQSDKIINRLTIDVDNNPLQLSDSSHHEVNLGIGEGQNFNLPDGIDDDAVITIRYDGHKIKKPFKEIPLYKYSSTC